MEREEWEMKILDLVEEKKLAEEVKYDKADALSIGGEAIY